MTGLIWVDKEVWDQKIRQAIVWLLIAYALGFVFSMALGNALIDGALLLALFRAGLLRQGEQIDKRMLAWMALYLASLFLAAAWSAPAEHAMKEVWHSFYYMAVPFLLGYGFFQAADDRSKFLKALLVATVSVSLYSYWQGLQGIKRVPGFIDLWELAGQLSLFIPVLLVMSSRGQKLLTRLGFGGALVLACGALILTGTRGAWVAVLFACGVFFFWQLYTGQIKRKHVLSLTGLAVLSILVVMTMFPAAQGRIHSLFNLKDFSLGARLAMWPSAWAMFVDHPLLGVGPGNYAQHYIDQYARPDLIRQITGVLYTGWQTHQHPHNSYLQLLAETGLLGFGSFLLLLLYTLRRCYRRSGPEDEISAWRQAAGLVLAAYLMFGMSENVVFGMAQYRQAMWLWIGLALSPNASTKKLPRATDSAGNFIT